MNEWKASSEDAVLSFVSSCWLHAQQQGRAAIISSIPQLGIIPTAQENAARVLVPLITQMGYQEQNIVIQFRKEYGLQDIKSLVNMDIEHGKK